MFGRCSKIVLCCLLASLVNDGFARKLSNADKTKRIIDGTPTKISNVPYLVQVRTSVDSECDCGGTLVDPTHVITAAHCLDNIDPVKALVVVGGAGTKRDLGVKRKIVAAYVHPGYETTENYENDVAVLKLDAPLKGKNIKTIKMSFDEVPDGKFLVVSGWGETENGKLGPHELLRTVSVKKTPKDVCTKQYANVYSDHKYLKKAVLTSSMICATSPGKDACVGDSGSSVTYRGQLVAVVSWGPKPCASSKYPGVYTSLKEVREFVEQSISK